MDNWPHLGIEMEYASIKIDLNECGKIPTVNGIIDVEDFQDDWV